MKFSRVVLLCLCFTGCAETRLYDRGQLVAVIQADATNVTIRSGSLYFHADTLNHSAATAAAYTGGTAFVGGVGAAVVSGLIAFP